MAKSDAEAEIEKIKILEERIRAPSIWCRLPCGLRFEDLQDTRYDEAIQLLENNYLTDEVTYRSVNIVSDKEGSDEFVNNARIWMKDKMSLAAVDEETNELIGVLIMRIQEKSSFSRTFSRVKLTYNINYTNIMTFYNEIEKPVNLYQLLDIRKYLKVYVVAVKTNFQHRGLVKKMLKSAISLSASANVPAIAGIFTAQRLQDIAEELGFVKLNEILYKNFVINDKVIFTQTGVNNHAAAFMAYRIPNIQETQEMQTQQIPRFNIAPCNVNKI
ncbi:unnamed protein product [Parnassius apollo]|uniref:(apollo) hypothetical protein n=1 Tax=Parnassius apollo TaxID=110799 RepID=A0A8S3XZW2_PARAO|nr:unnamed protein product [Parnassius apollo]